MPDDRYTTDVTARVAHVQELLRLQRLDEAVESLEAAPLEIRHDPRLLAAKGQVAEARGNWTDAVEAWTLYRQALPRAQEGVLGLGHALCRARRFAAAEAMLIKALADVPLTPRLAVLRAVTAMSSGAWQEARARWRTVLQLEPHHPAAAARIALCDAKIGQAAEAAALQATLDDFISLGRNCEFGLLQKQYGSEQPGLLRWAQARPPALLAALRAGLAGLGDPQWTKISLHGQQYMLRDEKYGIGFHTFIHETAGPSGDVLRKQSRRLRLLKDKLLHDLREARRIFVYQNAILPDEQAIEIHRALRGLGPVLLLCVREAQGDERRGVVRQLAPDLLLGTVAHEGLRPEGSWNICEQQWLSMIQEVHRHWAALRCPHDAGGRAITPGLSI